MICLIIVPFLGAINSINIRQMRKLNDYTVGAYMALFMFIVYGPVLPLVGEDLSIMKDFTYSDYGLIIVISIC